MSVAGIAMLSLFLHACDKQDELTVVNAYARDFYTGKPVPGYKTILVRDKNFSVTYPGDVLDTLVADIEGKTSYGFENERGYNYHLVCLPHPNYAGCDETSLRIDETNNITLRIKPFNRLKINVQQDNNSYQHIRIMDETQGALIYDSTFQNTEVVYDRSVPEERLHLSFRLYNGNPWGDHTFLDTNLLVGRVDTLTYTFVY